MSRKSDYAQVHFNLGLAYMKTGLKKEAIEEMQQVLRLKPNHQGARDNLKTC